MHTFFVHRRGHDAGSGGSGGGGGGGGGGGTFVVVGVALDAECPSLIPNTAYHYFITRHNLTTYVMHGG